MNSPNTIRAGGASVEILADSSKLDPGLREAESKLRAYNQRVKQLNKEATAAAKAGDQGQAIRIGMTSRELEKQSARITERAGTFSQRDDARSAMAQRLAAFKAGNAAMLTDQNEMEDRLAAATMKPRELALRDLDRHFTQMRTKYAGNAKMLAMIEQTSAAERAKVNADYSSGVLGTLGGKRMVKREVQYAAGNIIGAQGGEVGMAAQAALTMSPVAAGIVGALILIGGAYQAALKQVAALVEKQQAHADAVKESVRWMQRMTAAPTTGTGQQYASRADALEKEADDIEKASKKEAKDLGLMDAAWVAVQAAGSGSLKDTDLGRATQEDIARFRERQDQAKKLRAWAKEESGAEVLSRSRDQDAAVESARIAAMANGPEKDRLALLQRQSEEHRKMIEQQEERTRLLARDTTPGADQRRFDEANHQKSESAKFDQKAAFERAAQEREAQEYIRRDQVSALEAQITASKTGFARELALLQAKHRAEVEDYDKAGKDKKALLERQKADEQALYQRRDEQVGEIQDQLANAITAATGGVAGGRQVEWLGIAKQLSQLGLMEDQIRRIKDLWAQKNAAEDNKAVSDQIDDLNAKLAVATGKITAADAAMARFAKEHPDADKGQLDKLKALQATTDLAEFAKGELDRIKTPADQFKAYRQKLDDAVAKGVLDQGKEGLLLQAKMAELMGGVKPVGGFNISAINQMIGGGTVAERTAKAAEETAKNTRQLANGQGNGATFA